MKAFLFSIGESTTDISKWSLERQGFKVTLLYDPHTTLWEKYVEFLDMLGDDEQVLRCDADVIYNWNLLKFWHWTHLSPEIWWMSPRVYCYLKQDLVYAGTNVIKNPAFKPCKENILRFKDAYRPETELSRIKEFTNPRRYETYTDFVGYHGYKQRPEDISRVLKQKEQRGQISKWDWPLINKMKEL